MTERLVPEDALRRIADPEAKRRLGSFLKVRDHLPRIQWTRFVSVVYRLDLSERLDPEDIVLQMRPPLEPEVFEAMEGTIASASESGEVHDTARFERALLDLVRQGETEKVMRHLGTAAGRIGVVSRNPLRQQKDMFIVSTSIVARAAMDGGLNSELALSLSDAYIARCEAIQSLPAIMQLFPSMILEYTRRVAETKSRSPLSPLMRKVADYIYLHLADDIGSAELAAHFGYSRSHFSKLFAGEMGMSLPTFIAKERMDKAKDLLEHTDSSVAEISGLVGIVTPSRFISLFKRETGMTPLHYRLRGEGHGGNYLEGRRKTSEASMGGDGCAPMHSNIDSSS